MAHEFTYSKGELTVEQLQEEISGFWTELQNSPKLGAEVDAAGLDSRVLSSLGNADPIAVRLDSSGADPASVLLIIAFAPAGNRMLKDLWATVVLPRIRRRWGDDAIGDKIGGRDQ